MKTVCCPVCWIEHGIPDDMYERRKEQTVAGVVYCPNGHKWHFRGESEADKQRRRAEQAEQANARLHEEAQKAIRERNKAQTALKSHRKRSAAGLCPCCNRTFVNMARHMKSQHPDYNVVPLKTGPERLP
jgi:hypothetical protein